MAWESRPDQKEQHFTIFPALGLLPHDHLEQAMCALHKKTEVVSCISVAQTIKRRPQKHSNLPRAQCFEDADGSPLSYRLTEPTVRSATPTGDTVIFSSMAILEIPPRQQAD